MWPGLVLLGFLIEDVFEVGITAQRALHCVRQLVHISNLRVSIHLIFTI